MIVTQHSVSVSDGSHPGEARRIAGRIGDKLKFAEVRTAELCIVVIEAAKNLLAHAKQGELVLIGWENGGRQGVDMLSLDKGPGIQDLQRSLEDGYSTAGTPGNGLGAISRLSSSFDMYSNVGQGTVLYARLLDIAPGTTHPPLLQVGYVISPIAGETFCGDGFSFFCSGSRAVCILIDGLGHGVGAAEAAEAGLGLFEKHADQGPGQILARMHAAMRATRGAAVAISEIEFSSRKLRYCGVGNISGTIVDGPKTKSLVSHNGTVGHVAPRIAEFTYDFPPGSLLIMHSDGISSRWDISSYAGLQRRHPGVIAGVLYRDHRRIRDDASILVARQTAGVNDHDSS